MRLTKSRNLMVAACTLAVAAAISGSAQAALLVDRGLPTLSSNINASGANRSNVAWADDQSASPANTVTLEGDTFTNTSTSTWLINTIRIWTVGTFDSLALSGEAVSAAPGALSALSTTYTTTATTYANGASYSGSRGTSALTQIDFAVNLLINPGEQFVYFLNGTGGASGIPYMSASNAALSGLPQDQADDLIWEAVVGGATTPIDSFSTLGNGWDKASDFNVQVFGTALAAVPEPGSVALVGLGVLGLALARRRRS